jgi:hypothetical protein
MNVVDTVGAFIRKALRLYGPTQPYATVRLSTEIINTLLAMPPGDRADFAEVLLKQAPVDEARHLVPLVLYFKTQADRDAAAAALVGAFNEIVEHPAEITVR